MKGIFARLSSMLVPGLQQDSGLPSNLITSIAVFLLHEVILLQNTLLEEALSKSYPS